MESKGEQVYQLLQEIAEDWSREIEAFKRDQLDVRIIATYNTCTGSCDIGLFHAQEVIR